MISESSASVENGIGVISFKFISMGTVIEIMKDKPGIKCHTAIQFLVSDIEHCILSTGIYFLWSERTNFTGC